MLSDIFNANYSRFQLRWSSRSSGAGMDLMGSVHNLRFLRFPDWMDLRCLWMNRGDVFCSSQCPVLGKSLPPTFLYFSAFLHCWVRSDLVGNKLNLQALGQLACLHSRNYSGCKDYTSQCLLDLSVALMEPGFLLRSKTFQGLYQNRVSELIF